MDILNCKPYSKKDILNFNLNLYQKIID